ncbi:hypothetical protein NHH88_29800 [Oxalobacteraceae bacterium OTU3CAMAD1]|nr:hypothetical protein NHH88_29800 [Oxalobacteraceae bacterium OTU3CAMAD1]
MSLIERLTRPLQSARLRPLAGRRLHILLAPQQLSCVVRQGSRVIEGSAQQIALVNPGGHWQASLDALRALLIESAATWAGLQLEISLSGRWSHMVVAPWSEALLSEPGAAHFLQSQLTALYGDAARGWHVVGDDAPYGQARVVCGIDATLLHALKELAEECGHSCRVVEPLLCTALRSLAAEDARAPSAALALIEPGRITMAALDRGRIVAIQSQPASGAWRQELPQAWQRWTLRLPELAAIEHVAVVDPGTAPGIGPNIASGAIVQLVADTLPPRFRIVANPFGVAVMAPQPATASSGVAA